MVIDGLNLCVICTATGELLRQLAFKPTSDYGSNPKGTAALCCG